ncbi:MAG: substrate-binding domain-containing protein [Lachnospiraceae bacterium]|nr:substrate-binding domain-containing protein [Lachnospiraceae bacterium]
MRRKKHFWLLCLGSLFTAALLLGGCSAGSTTPAPVDGLDTLGAVQVISREDGSGTRSAFAGLVGFDTSTDGTKEDDTTDDAIIMDSTEAVIAAVADHSAAIGYISMGAATNSADIKILAVDGIEATTENVQDNSYSLSRPFSLAWSGKLNDLEQDFLTYVLGSGQAIVGQSYVAVNSSSTFLSGQYEGTITIHGSTSAAPLLAELAEAYMEINPHAIIEVTASDSTTGLNDAMQGACDFAMSSRALKDYEQELLDYEVIAQDGIAVIVNSLNPLTDITTEELNDIFTGSINDWAAINTDREG